MSYILDALQKAEQERRRGAVPGLQTPAASAAPAARPSYWLYGVLALSLLVAGVLIGWWQPWRSPAKPQPVAVAPEPAPAPVVAAAVPTAPVPVSATPQPSPPLAPSLAAPLPAPARPLPAAPPPSVVTSPAPVVAAPVSKPALEEAQPLESLPASVRQGIPAMTVLVHSYSSQRKDRLVIVNNKPLHEGDSLVAGLRLEEITTEGMIFSYQGYRFRTGVR
ncbi:general secretion pathway protein GspB [Chitinimonas sp.]|uniref:general secretion pathway protein GspB n=1 Tax=Chitinimonas sp. TaxID=1934313 RepID=UPI002F92D58D